MPLYEITPDRIAPLPETTFIAAGLKERADIQRLLREQVEIISANTLVVAEEFGEWEDARRRIDLLGLDRDAKALPSNNMLNYRLAARQQRGSRCQ